MPKPYIIGIAGGTASGKSTLSEKLESVFSDYNIRVFHMDKYFKPRQERPYTKAFVTGKEYTDDNHPLTMNLKKLAEDIKDSLDMDFEIIIVEGLMTLWDDSIYEMLDLKIFIDCKSDERLVRRIKRNMAKGLTFDEITDVFLDMVRYRHEEYVEPSKWRADIILNGSKFSETALMMIKEFAEKRIGK